MADAFSTNLGLTLMTNGEHNNTWNDEYKSNDQRIDAKFGDRTAITTTGGTTALSAAQERVNVIKVSGTLVSNATIEFTGVGGTWIVHNNTTGAFSLTCKISGQTGVTIVQGDKVPVYFDGTDIAKTSVGLGVALNAISALTPAADTFAYFTSGSAAALATVTSFARTVLDDTTSTAARATLGVAIGTDVQAYDADLTTLGAGGASARSFLGLAIGTDVQAYDADLTTLGAGGASARSFLGLAIGTDVQAWDADLDAIAALAKTDSNFIVGDGATWVAESGATVRTSLGLAIGTNVQAYDADLTTLGAGGASARSFLGLAIGTDVQAYDADLTTLGAGGAGARNFLGLGTGDSPTFTGLTVTGTAVIGNDSGDAVTVQGTALISSVVQLLGSANKAAFANAVLDNISGSEVKGTIIYHNGTDWVELPIGTTGQTLTADPSGPNGLRWL